MSAKPAKIGFGVKLVVVLAIVAAAAVIISINLRPVAVTAPAYKGKAISAVPGSITVIADVQDLVSEVEGRVLTSELAAGKKVKKGDVLAQLITKELDLEIEQLESEYDAAKKKLKIGSATEIERDIAKDNLDNVERLYGLKERSEQDVIAARRSFEVVRMKLENEKLNNAQSISNYENALATKRNLRSKMTFVAQFDGVVSLVLALPGALLPAKTPIATLISTNRTVEARISEENFSGIKVGQKATVHFLSQPNNCDAYVTQILPTADAGTQRYVVYLDVKIDPEKLVPGITGEVSIIVGERDGATLIPRRALFGDRVYVVVNGRVQLRKVEVGFVGLDEAEIIKGLGLGEEVIVEQLDRFRDGDRVRVEAQAKK